MKRMGFRLAAHRGVMSEKPENTLSSFRLASSFDATEIELDLRASKDGELVVMHDATVDRTTDGTGTVAELTLAELRALDAGEGQRIPTFEEVIDAVDLPFQVEFKSRDAVEPFVDLVTRTPGLATRMSPTSFDEDIVRTLARQLPELPVGLISTQASLDLVDRALGLGARRVLFGWTGTDRTLVDQAHDRDVHYGVWPVNSVDQFVAAAELGVDGVTSDHPRVMRDSGYHVVDGQLTRV